PLLALAGATPGSPMSPSSSLGGASGLAPPLFLGAPPVLEGAFPVVGAFVFDAWVWAVAIGVSPIVSPQLMPQAVTKSHCLPRRNIPGTIRGHSQGVRAATSVSTAPHFVAGL